jgi:hypothetical protein
MRPVGFFSYAAWKVCGGHLSEWTAYKPGRIFVFSTVAMTVAALIFLFRQTKRLEASFPNEDGGYGGPAEQSTGWNTRLKPGGKFVRRYGPHEPQTGSATKGTDIFM